MIRQITFEAMGSAISASLDSIDDRVDRILKEVPLWFEEWEQCLSRFRLDSELNQLNRSGGKMFRVSKTLWEVIQLSLQVAEESSGYVTPTVLRALETAGYTRDFELIRSSKVYGLQEFRSVPDYQEIILQEEGRWIGLPIGMRLDLGGVAKGWAAMQAITRLKEYDPAMVDAGGDIMTSSALLDGSPWPISVIDPFQPDLDMEMLSLSGDGVATSGQDYRNWTFNGMRMHHIIDVRTGRPAESDVYAATVIAPNVIQAEMAAKVVLILGSEEGLRWLEDQTDYAGSIVTLDGSRMSNESFQSYVWSNECLKQR